MKQKKYVIIGNSAAAAGCVEGIRKYDKDGTITIISREPYHIYSRPLISYLLLGKTDMQRMKYRPDSFYQDMNCTALLGVTAERIDAKSKNVLCADQQIAYDQLLIAAGSNPFVPPLEVLDSVEKKFTFMSLDVALQLKQVLTPDSRVLIVGAGLIGLKCAEGIAHMVKQIEVTDLADRVLPSILDREGAEIVRTHLEANGIRFRLADSISRFAAGTAFFTSGAETAFDVLVLAVGVRPNTSLGTAAGCAVDRGILVDARSRTNVPDIFSAGDCTQYTDISSNQSKIMALLPNAYMQGFCAGVNMACPDADATEAAFDNAIPMNAIGFFGLHIVTAGSCLSPNSAGGNSPAQTGGGADEYVSVNGTNYKRLTSRNGLLTGYMLIGDIGRAGIYTSLIRSRTPLSATDYDLLKEKPQLLAFSRSYRKQVLS